MSDERILQAVSYWDRKCPESLVSNVMFFKGLRITRMDFENILTNNTKEE